MRSRVLAAGSADEIAKRPVRDPLPVRETAAFEHGGFVAHACQQLVHEAGLRCRPCR